MKKFKKLFAVILSLAMVLGMSLTAFATEPKIPTKDNPVAATGKKGDKATISVGGLSTDNKDSGIEAYAYPIIVAKYQGNSEEGAFTGYDVVYKDVSPIITLPEVKAGVMEKVNITQKHLTAIMDKINTDGSIQGTKMNISNGVATAEVPVGSYLIVIKGAETKVYSPVVASLYYVNSNGTNAMAGEPIANIAADQAWVKVTDTPKVNKFIVENNEDKKGNTVKIGDEIDYKVEVGPIPYYGGSNPILNLVDTMDVGLDRVTKLEDVNVSISNGLTTVKKLVKDTDYTIQETENNPRKITINFVVAGYKAAHPNDKDVLSDYTLNEFASNPSNKIVVTYKAKVNNDATINQTANKNDVVLNFTKDSKLSGDDVKDNDEDIVYSYTFDIDGGIEGSITDRVINKRGETVDETTENTGKAGLDGAEFGLYTDQACKTLYTNSWKDKDGNEQTFGGIVTTANGGQMHIKGLDEGTYYLQERKAPGSYSVNTNVYKIVIEATYVTSTDKKVAGQIQSWTIKIDNVTVATETGKTSTFTVNQGNIVENTTVVNGTDIQNTKLSSLPSTGGIGTTIFTIGGCAIMIIAAALFFASRRKSAK
ncbi:MAG: LPXTG cell wall anchor domain-containing protein [Lachnospiraceae bacterium]